MPTTPDMTEKKQLSQTLGLIIGVDRLLARILIIVVVSIYCMFCPLVTSFWFIPKFTSIEFACA
jgi:hypothetical protein